MDPKLLTENGWKTIALKSKVKDNGLQKALAAYEKLDEKEHDDCLKAIASVSQLAATLKKAREVAAVPEVVKYLNDVMSAADASKAAIIKDKAAADKAEAAQALAQKKAESDAKEQEQDDEEEEEQGDYKAKLLAAFQKLKGAKGLSFQFIVCDAKPHCGLMVAKKITPKHKEELTNITGGSKRFLPIGACQFQDGHFVFSMEQAVSGIARKLQDSIKNFTGKKFPIVVGTESAEDDEPEPSAAAAAPSAAKPATPALAKAPELWHGTRGILENKIKDLKQAIRNEFAGQSPELIAGIEGTVSKLDVILDKLDKRLADSLAKAHSAKDGAARQAELKNSKAILLDYIGYVKSEPLIAHIDTNPFGIQTNLKQVLSDSLKHMAEAIG